MHNKLIFFRFFLLPMALLWIICQIGWMVLAPKEYTLPIPVWGIFLIISFSFWISRLIYGRKKQSSDNTAFFSDYLKGGAIRAVIILCAILIPVAIEGEKQSEHLFGVLFFMLGYVYGQFFYLRLMIKVNYQ